MIDPNDVVATGMPVKSPGAKKQNNYSESYTDIATSVKLLSEIIAQRDTRMSVDTKQEIESTIRFLCQELRGE